MAVFLGSLEYVLEEGPSNDWFQDERGPRSRRSPASSAASPSSGARSRRKQPIVDLRAFTDRNFAAGCAFSFVMGIGLYGLTYLYPVYLARVRGYSALQIGETMFVTGVFMFLTAPVAGMPVAQARPAGDDGHRLRRSSPSAPGMVTGLTKDWDFWELFVPQILRGVGLMIVHGADQQHRARHLAAATGSRTPRASTT